MNHVTYQMIKKTWYVTLPLKCDWMLSLSLSPSLSLCLSLCLSLALFRSLSLCLCVRQCLSLFVNLPVSLSFSVFKSFYLHHPLIFLALSPNPFVWLSWSVSESESVSLLCLYLCLCTCLGLFRTFLYWYVTWLVDRWLMDIWHTVFSILWNGMWLIDICDMTHPNVCGVVVCVCFAYYASLSVVLW